MTHGWAVEMTRNLTTVTNSTQIMDFEFQGHGCEWPRYGRYVSFLSFAWLSTSQKKGKFLWAKHLLLSFASFGD